MKKLLLLVLASLAFTSACAGPRIASKQDSLLKRCTGTVITDDSGRQTTSECRDSNP